MHTHTQHQMKSDYCPNETHSNGMEWKMPKMPKPKAINCCYVWSDLNSDIFDLLTHEKTVNQLAFKMVRAALYRFIPNFFFPAVAS